MGASERRKVVGGLTETGSKHEVSNLLPTSLPSLAQHCLPFIGLLFPLPLPLSPP